MLLADVCSAIGYLGASRRLHVALLVTVMRSPMAFYDSTPLGRVINRFSKDVDVMDSVLPHIINVFLWCFLNVVATCFVISVNLPLILVILAPLVVLYWFTQVIDRL